MALAPTLACLSSFENAFLANTVTAVWKDAKAAMKNNATVTRNMTTLSIIVKQKPKISIIKANPLNPKAIKQNANANLLK